MLVNRKRVEKDVYSFGARAVMWIFVFAGFFAMCTPLIKFHSLDTTNFIISMIVMILFGSFFSVFIGLRTLIRMNREYKAIKNDKFYIIIDEINSLQHKRTTRSNNNRVYISLKRQHGRRIEISTSLVPSDTRRGEQIILIMPEGTSDVNHAFFVYPGNRYTFDPELMKYLR